MPSTSLAVIKKELQQIPKDALVEICLRLAKYKKENKELLHYILFENINEQEYINSINEMLEKEFEKVNTANMFFTKKSIRRILKIANKYIHYSNLAETEIQILICFCKQMQLLNIDFSKSTAMENLYKNLLNRINKSINTLHEDLQYDYTKKLELILK